MVRCRAGNKSRELRYLSLRQKSMYVKRSQKVHKLLQCCFQACFLAWIHNFLGKELWTHRNIVQLPSIFFGSWWRYLPFHLCFEARLCQINPDGRCFLPPNVDARTSLSWCCTKNHLWRSSFLSMATEHNAVAIYNPTLANYWGY